MPEPADRYARLERLLSGALGLWAVAGRVERDGNALVVRTTPGRILRIVASEPRGWTVHEADGPFCAHAGLPGLLRQLREELAPEVARGRMIVGAQPLR